MDKKEKIEKAADAHASEYYDKNGDRTSTISEYAEWSNRRHNFIAGAEWALSQTKEVALQKPVDSDVIAFLEWIGNDWTKLKKGWMKSDLYTTIEATHTTKELYEQFKQLK